MANSTKQSKMEPDRFMTPDEVAERWAVTRKYVIHLAYEHRVPSIKIGGRVRFRPADIARYEAENFQAADD